MKQITIGSLLTLLALVAITQVQAQPGKIGSVGDIQPGHALCQVFHQGFLNTYKDPPQIICDDWEIPFLAKEYAEDPSLAATSKIIRTLEDKGYRLVSCDRSESLFSCTLTSAESEPVGRATSEIKSSDLYTK